MAMKYWNRQISFINQAKCAVIRTSDYDGLYSYEQATALLAKLNALLLVAEDRNLKNEYENKDFITQKKEVVSAVMEFVAVTDAAVKSNGEDYKAFRDDLELAVNFTEQD